jgi:hypothetical protein
MSVDLANLVESLQIEIQAPGGEAYANATEDDYLGNLINAFWEIRLYGFLAGFEEDAASRGGPAEFAIGIITPLRVDPAYDDPFGYNVDEDLSRDLQQLIVLWAAWKIMLNNMATVNSVFRAKAGPVEYETQQAASVLTAVLDQLKARITYLIGNLPTASGGGGGAVVLDAVIERTYSQAVGDVWWVRG